MNYLTKFDSAGKRITSYSVDNFLTPERYAELVSKGYIEISEADWNYYVGNKGQGKNGTGYIRGADGKPTDAPLYEPSKEEQLAQLDADYAMQKKELVNQYTDDMLHGDSEAVEADKEAMTELDAWYDEEYAKLEGAE